MGYNYRPWALLVLTLVMAACDRIETAATSLEPQPTTTAVDSDSSTNDSTSVSSQRPADVSYRQRYLSEIAPRIVHCMNDLGWEATYDPQHGAVLAEVPPSQEMERDGAMSFCVAGSQRYREIYAD